MTWPREFLKFLGVVEVGVPCSNVGNAFRIANKSVVSVSEREEFMLSSEESCKENGHVIRFTTTVAQEYLIIFRAKLITKCLGILALELSQVDGGGMDEFIGLFGNDLGDGRMGMSY